MQMKLYLPQMYPANYLHQFIQQCGWARKKAGRNNYNFKQKNIFSHIFDSLRLLVHSSISNVNKTIDKVKLKDAILCIM